MEAEIAAICEKEGLELGLLQSVSGGHVNRIYRGGGCVVRIARGAEDGLRLRQEAALLQRLRDQSGGALLAPEILGAGECEGRFYQVQREVRGEPLHLAWPGLSLDQKNTLMAQLGAQLEMLHGFTCPTFGWFRLPEVTYPTWGAYVETFYRAALDLLGRSSPGLSAPLLAAAGRFLEERLPLLAESRPVVVHADLWPGNILVDGDELAGILDFEFAYQAPRDYELVLIEDFCLYPNDFIAAERGKRSTADYADFFPLLARHTPGLFAVPHLRERLDLHHVLFNLQLYHSWREANPQAEENAYLLAKLARIVNMLFGHGARMFQ
jgi:Ser/Thr protein kinase RdoA (MazF antagonist)